MSRHSMLREATCASAPPEIAHIPVASPRNQGRARSARTWRELGISSKNAPNAKEDGSADLQDQDGMANVIEVGIGSKGENGH